MESVVAGEVFAGEDLRGVRASRARIATIAGLAAGCILGLMTFAPPAPAQGVVGGALDPSFINVGPNGDVREVLVQPDGKILVSGFFTGMQGELRQRVARLNADGTVDPTFANPVVAGGSGDFVEAMILQPDGKIVIGGDFTKVGGQEHADIARINANGSIDSSFNPAPNGNVYALALQPNGKILVGGNFTKFKVGGVDYGRNYVARLNADGGLDNSFANAGANGVVYSVVVAAGGNVLVGGAFTQFPNANRERIARLTAKGQVDSGFKANANSTVYDLALQPDGKIIAGGNFALINFAVRNRVARLNADGSVDASFPDANPNASVWSVSVQPDGKILVGGQFTLIGTGGPQRIARLNTDGTLDNSFRPQVSGTVSDVALQPDGKVMIVGYFVEVENRAQEKIARLFGNTEGGGSNGGGSNDGPTPTPADALNVSAVKARVSRRSATVRSQVKVSGAGKITQLATTGSKKLKLRCRTTRTVSAASTSTFTCKMGRKGRRALKNGSLKLTLRTTFTPTAGTSVTTDRKLTIKRKR